MAGGLLGSSGEGVEVCVGGVWEGVVVAILAAVVVLVGGRERRACGIWAIERKRALINGG